VTNLVPKCPLNVGPYQATVKTAKLNLTDASGKQGAVLSTTTTLHLGDHQSVDGVASVDLTTGKFSKLSFDMNKSFDWSVPKKNPVFVFHINKAHIGLDGLKIDGRQKLKLQNSSTDVTFDHMVLNLNTMRLKSGKVIIDQGVGFKSGIDASDNMTFRAVSDTTTLGSKAGLMMALQSAIVIDTAGAHVKGEADATLHFNKWKLDTLKATFNQNFALGFSPFGIKRGQINFDWKDQRIAYADNSGFHPDPSFFGNKLLPDKIPLPVTSIAYLQIKQNDTLLVTAKQQQNGTYLLNTKPGAKLKLVMPAFKGNLPNNPELDVTLQNVHINPSTAQIQSGTVIADVPANDTTFNLSRLGVPMYLTRVAYGTNADPNLPSNALILDGKLTIFHHPFNDQSGSVTAEIAQNGYLSANVDLENLDENVPLDGDANRTSLVLNTVKGNINTNVNGAVQPSYNFNLDGTFQINDLNGNPAAHTGIQAQLNQNEMTVSVTQANALNQPAKINLGSLKLGIQQIQNLSLNWSSRLGLSYDVDMDLNLTMDLDSGQDFKAPLKNVELKSDVGIIIPQQDINDNSNPPLQSPGFDVGAFHLKPIAFHVKKDTIHFFTFQSGDLVHLIPHADFELTFPGFKNTLPQLQHTTATLNNVGFNNGILDGTLEPLTIPNGGILVPLSAHTGLKVQKISGSLGAANDGSQNYDIHISGKLKEPDFFTSKNQNCPDKTFSVQLNKEGGLTGTVHNFTPCGQLVMGPVSLGFSNTELDFGFSNNKQTLTMEGDASATLKTDNTTPLTATGNLKLDILQGEVLSGNINLQGPFTFYYPSRDSIFQFTVQHAQINNNGFVLTGNGSLDADGKSVNVAFNNAAFDLVGGSISTGSIQIQDQIGLEVGLDPTKWSLVDPSQPISVNKGLRFVLPQNISIDKNGVNINGTSTVAMRYGKHNGDNYQVQFHNLLLGLSPVGVTSGRADIDRTQQNGQSERIAFYDNKGFHLDNVLAAVNVPDTLGLPSKDIAYLVLRDPATKTLKVKTQNTPNGGLRLTTKSGQKVKMVLVGFNKSLNIQLDVEVNNTFSKITGGSIKAVPTNPIDLKQALHIPLAIDTVKFEQPKGQNLFKLLASVSIKLPDALNNIPLSINNVAIGKSGFKNASISAGTIWQDDSNVPTKPVAKPLISKSFADSNFVMAIDGAKIQLGNSKKVQLSGEFYSKLLVDHSTKKMQHLFYTAGYSVSNNKWSFSSNASDLVNQLGLGNKYLRLNMDQLSLESGSNNFGVDIDGRISSPDILGQGFAVTVKDLKIGTNGVSIGSVGTNNSNTQTVSLLNGKATIKQPSLNVTYQNDLLSLVLSGQLNFLGKQFDINDLSIRSDGHVSMGNGSVELIGQNKSYNIIGSYVQLTSLKVIVDNSAGLKLQAQGKAKLPDVIAENADPGSQTSSTFTVTVDKNGHITSQGPDFDTSGKLANLSLGDIATINLTGAGMHLNLTDMAQSIFYVDANLFIDKDPGSKGNTNKIQFGVPNNNNNNSEDVSNYGFYYQNGNVNWNISNTPSFSFNTSFFKLSLQNVSTGTAANNHNSGFNLKMNLGANLKLKGFTSSITLKDMEINKAGISDFGHINSGSLSLGSKITISIGQFSHGSNTDIHIAKASGSADKSIGKSDTTIHVQEYLRFGSESGTPALHINIADLPKASVQEVLYYKTNNSLRLTVKDATVGFGNYINLKAGFDYHYTDSDNWILKVAASGHFNFSSSGGSGSSGSGTGFDALGKLGKVDGDFTFGVYFQLDASIPIVPPRLIVANSIGGGFFYNGTNDDIHHVMHDVMHYKSDIGGNEPWKGQGSHKYIVMFEAKVDVIKLPDNIPGTSVDSYVQGSMFLVTTDQSFFLDVKATYFGMKQGNDPELYGDLSLSYKDNGNGKWSFNATGSVHANFHSVITGK
ncbi:MAG TPA: hypothetical protein VJ991_07875, partial [Balneolales bacterium]|nr:hypothetical protein [Balneolales bacterium]